MKESPLENWIDRIPLEDFKMSSKQLVQCPTNLRTVILSSMWRRSIEQISNYKTDLEDNRDASLKSRHLFEQKRLASRVNKDRKELISLLNRLLNIHWNVGQHFAVNSPGVSMSLLDEEGKETPFRTSVNQPVEMIIPPMNLENVTGMTNDPLDRRLFNFHSLCIWRFIR